MPESDKMTIDSERFSAYMTETTTNHPWWSRERLEEAADLWHGRNGYKPGTFKLDSAISEPEKGDPLSKGDKRKPEPKKALKDKDQPARPAAKKGAKSK
jgi:hypothetical protein